MKEKKEMQVEVDGKFETREVDFIVHRDGSPFRYPKINDFEHIYENEKRIFVFTSTVK
jgi:hypothetical protein|tara:strand:- start:1339 stop:1512 length:174 start_codon:yes stop_codon:yes gene_type:complete